MRVSASGWCECVNVWYTTSYDAVYWNENEIAFPFDTTVFFFILPCCRNIIFEDFILMENTFDFFFYYKLLFHSSFELNLVFCTIQLHSYCIL